MKVKDVMVGTPAFCSPETNLAAAAEMFWNRNCGILPVLGRDGKLKGIITDRDVCIALGTRNRLASDLAAAEVMNARVISCSEEDDIRSAVDVMRREGVRRLPVLGADGMLKGILSMDDVVRHSSDTGRAAELPYDEVVTAFKSIYTHQLPGLVRAKTAVA